MNLSIIGNIIPITNEMLFKELQKMKFIKPLQAESKKALVNFLNEKKCFPEEIITAKVDTFAKEMSQNWRSCHRSTNR